LENNRNWQDKIGEFQKKSRICFGFARGELLEKMAEKQRQQAEARRLRVLSFSGR
jgi:hypothetical protein